MNVSVVIPTYNRPKGAKEAIESVLNQTKLPQEIIVVDDNSREPLDLNIETDVKILYHRFDKNKGGCAARNKGVELSDNEIIMFLDDDDTWEPRKIESQLSVFENNPKIGLVYSGRLVVSDADRSKVKYEVKPDRQGNLYPDILENNYIGITSSVAIKKDVFNKAGGFDERFPARQDYDLWIRVCKITEIGHDNECNVRYTIFEKSENQISGKASGHEKAISLLLDKYRKEINEQPPRRARRIKSNFHFYLAKNKKRRSYLESIPFALKSFFTYPNPKAVAILFPDKVINALRGR